MLYNFINLFNFMNELKIRRNSNRVYFVYFDGDRFFGFLDSQKILVIIIDLGCFNFSC